MPTFSMLRSLAGSAIVLTTFVAGCRDEPKPTPDPRASQVSAKDKPAAQKSEPSVSAAPSAAPAPTTKPAVALASAAPSAAPAASASAVVEAPATPPDPSLDCDKLLTPEDIFTACNVKVEAPTDQPTDDIGSERTCSRRFSSKEAGTVSMLVVRHSSVEEALERYRDFTVTSSKPEPIEGVGDMARKFEKKGITGDPIFTVETVKGRFNVSVFNPKITVGGQTVGPVCDQAALEKVLRALITRLP